MLIFASVTLVVHIHFLNILHLSYLSRSSSAFSLAILSGLRTLVTNIAQAFSSSLFFQFRRRYLTIISTLFSSFTSVK